MNMCTVDSLLRIKRDHNITAQCVSLEKCRKRIIPRVTRDASVTVDGRTDLLAARRTNKPSDLPRSERDGNIRARIRQGGERSRERKGDREKGRGSWIAEVDAAEGTTEGTR